MIPQNGKESQYEFHQDLHYRMWGKTSIRPSGSKPYTRACADLEDTVAAA